MFLEAAMPLSVFQRRCVEYQQQLLRLQKIVHQFRQVFNFRFILLFTKQFVDVLGLLLFLVFGGIVVYEVLSFGLLFLR